MANTLGGWIIIGVDDDKKSDKPKLPVEGIDFKKQLSLEVTNIVIDNISPPSLPIIHVCEPDKNNKTFVVICSRKSKKLHTGCLMKIAVSGSYIECLLPRGNV